MVEITSFNQYMQLGRRTFNQYGIDQNNDGVFSREELSEAQRDRFEAIAGQDGDSVSISYQDVLSDSGHTLAPGLERQIEEQRYAPGQYYGNDPFLGALAVRAADFSLVVGTNSRYQSFFHDIYERPINGTDFFPIMMMIPENLRVEASALADRHLNSLFAQIPGRGSGNSFSLVSEFMTGVTRTEMQGEQNPWHISVLIDANGFSAEHDGQRYHLPWQIIASHELGHVARTRPYAPEQLGSVRNAAEEMAIVCEQIVLQDSILREIRGLGPTVPIEYDYNIETDNGVIDLGELAILVRDLITRYGNVEAALSSGEFQSFLDRYYPTP